MALQNKSAERAGRLRQQRYPETAIGGFSRVDGGVEFYTRVNTLVTKASVVVDLGAGRGQWLDNDSSQVHKRLQNFRGQVDEVIGIDIDRAVTENASLDRAIVTDLNTTWPIDAESVDLIVSDFTLEHVMNPQFFANEVDRILKPGGWFCARTPHKYGYIGLAARAVPNESHGRWVGRLQPSRHAEDIFPVAYRMNTKSALERAFPSDRFTVTAYGHAGEPNYAGGSQVLWYGFDLLRRVLPRSLGPMVHIFVEKGRVA